MMRPRLFLLVLILILTIFPLAGKGKAAVTVLFFNDLHGHLQPFTMKDETGQNREVGGVARMATLIKKIRRENEKNGSRTLLLVAGDILQGTPISTLFQGQAEIDVLNALKVDAMTIGNHEFDFGLENFLRLKKSARFPFLSMNVAWKENNQRVSLEGIGFKLNRKLSISVLGITTSDLMVTSHPSNVGKIQVFDAVTCVKKYYSNYRSRGPVLLLSHSQFSSDQAVAQAFPDLTAIIGGHDQVLFNPFRQVGEVPIFQAFEKGKFLGRLDLEIEGGKCRIRHWEYLPITAEIPADPEIEALVKTYIDRMDVRFKEVVGQARTFLYGERDKIRYEETNLGDWVTDLMREVSRADIALLNSGALRSSIAEGPITVETVFKAMPFPNELMIVSIPGSLLQQILTRSVKGSRGEEDGGFLQVSGLRLIIQEKSIQEVKVNGQPLDPEKIYRVALTDFIAAGGDGYSMLKDLPKTATGLPLREILLDAIRNRKEIAPITDGRILRLKE